MAIDGADDGTEFNSMARLINSCKVRDKNSDHSHTMAHRAVDNITTVVTILILILGSMSYRESRNCMHYTPLIQLPYVHDEVCRQ